MNKLHNLIDECLDEVIKESLEDMTEIEKEAFLAAAAKAIPSAIRAIKSGAGAARNLASSTKNTFMQGYTSNSFAPAAQKGLAAQTKNQLNNIVGGVKAVHQATPSVTIGAGSALAGGAIGRATAPKPEEIVPKAQLPKLASDPINWQDPLKYGLGIGAAVGTGVALRKINLNNKAKMQAQAVDIANDIKPGFDAINTKINARMDEYNKLNAEKVTNLKSRFNKPHVADAYVETANKLEDDVRKLHRATPWEKATREQILDDLTTTINKDTSFDQNVKQDLIDIIKNNFKIPDR